MSGVYNRMLKWKYVCLGFGKQRKQINKGTRWDSTQTWSNMRNRSKWLEQRGSLPVFSYFKLLTLTYRKWILNKLEKAEKSLLSQNSFPSYMNCCTIEAIHIPYWELENKDEQKWENKIYFHCAEITAVNTLIYIVYIHIFLLYFYAIFNWCDIILHIFCTSL